MIGGTVILKCSKKRWEKDSKRAKEFSRWASDSGIYYEFEWLEGDDISELSEKSNALQAIGNKYSLRYLRLDGKVISF